MIDDEGETMEVANKPSAAVSFWLVVQELILRGRAISKKPQAAGLRQQEQIGVARPLEGVAPPKSSPEKPLLNPLQRRGLVMSRVVLNSVDFQNSANLDLDKNVTIHQKNIHTNQLQKARKGPLLRPGQ